MDDDAQVDMLESLLASVTSVLSPEAAKRLVDWRVDADAQRRIDELAEKANDGALSPDERAEYESLVNVGSMISLMQAKARDVLSRTTAA